MTLPDPGATMHVASVDYAVSFAETSSADGTARFANPMTHFIFTFDTGETEDPAKPGHWTVSWDTSKFDQAAREAGIASALDQTCADVAVLLGLTQAQVQATVTVRRLWTLGQNSYDIIPGVSSGPQKVLIPDVMPYPPSASAAAGAAAGAGTLGAAVTAG